MWTTEQCHTGKALMPRQYFISDHSVTGRLCWLHGMWFQGTMIWILVSHDPSIVIICHYHLLHQTCIISHFHGLHYVTLATFLFFDSPLFFSYFFLFLFCFWKDCPTNEGCCFNAKLFATCPKWSFLIINILFSSPRWAVYARTQEQNPLLASSSILGWKGQGNN